MAVVPVVPVVGVTDVHVCASDGISLRMCEDNTSHPVEMPKLNLYPPDYKVVCFCKKIMFLFLFCLLFFPYSLYQSRSVSRSVLFLCCKKLWSSHVVLLTTNTQSLFHQE